MLTVQKSYGIVQRILTRLTSLKMANLQTPAFAGVRTEVYYSQSVRQQRDAAVIHAPSHVQRVGVVWAVPWLGRGFPRRGGRGNEERGVLGLFGLSPWLDQASPTAVAGLEWLAS